MWEGRSDHMISTDVVEMKVAATTKCRKKTGSQKAKRMLGTAISVTSENYIDLIGSSIIARFALSKNVRFFL